MAQDKRRRHSAGPRKGDLREQSILDVTERLLDEQGFDATTLTDIARAAELSRGAMYFYVESKHDAVVAVVARAVEDLRDKSRAAAGDPADPRDAIATTMNRTRDIWRDHGVVMRVAIDQAATVPRIDELWTETADIFTDAIATILRRAGADPGPHGFSATSRSLCWMIERSFYQASRESPAALDAATDTCRDLWLRIAGLT